MNDPDPSRRTTPDGATIHRITVGFTDKHKVWLETYKKGVGELSGLVLEIVRDKPELLLSPIFRDLLAEKADVVRNHHKILGDHLYVDMQP
jgi:hypothetical protein